MRKPLIDYVFRPIEGVWKEQGGKYSGTYADFLAEYDLVADDRCVFARFRDYDRNCTIYLRAELYKIRVTIWSWL